MNVCVSVRITKGPEMLSHIVFELLTCPSYLSLKDLEITSWQTLPTFPLDGESANTLDKNWGTQHYKLLNQSWS